MTITPGIPPASVDTSISKWDQFYDPGGTSRVALTSSIDPPGEAGINVKAAPYNAVGDGTTDDTAAITTAIAAAHAAGGGTVFFPAGIYVTGKQTVYTRVRYQGDTSGLSVLKLKAGETTNLLEGESFSTLTGGSTNGGPVQWSIRDLTLDGNKANCPAALRGLAVYGSEFLLFNVHVHDCVTDGIFLEFRGDSSTRYDSQVIFSESFGAFIKVQNCGGNGLWVYGCHDSAFYGVNCGFNGGGSGSATGGFRAENNGVHFTACHAYGTQQDYAWNLRGQSFLVDCIGEGACTSQFFCAFSEANILGGSAYYPGDSASAAVTFGATSDDIVVNGLYIEKGGSSFDFAPAIDFTNLGARAIIKAKITQATGTAYSGTVPTDADVEILVGGGATPGNLWQQPSAPIPAAIVGTFNPLPAAVFDSFTLTDGTAADSTKWTTTVGSGTGAALAVASNALKFTTGNTGSFSVNDDVTVESTLATTLADAELLFATVVGTVNAQSFLYAGLRSANKAPIRATDSYFFESSVNISGVLNFLIIKRVSSAQTTLYTASNAPGVVTLGVKYWHRFRVKGTSIKYKYWLDGAVEPAAWNLDTTDSSVTGGGICSFNAGGGSPAGSNAYQSLDSVAVFAL